jgi:5-(carboxyamino)imidazole ribonucleotide synthase
VVSTIAPPAAIGMLGGGQLGRYALIAARTMGFRTLVVDPDPDAPAGAVADRHLVSAYDDVDALDALAARCAVVTTEFENPPAAALVALAQRTLVAPDPSCVAIAQDRVAEKEFLDGGGLPTVPWAPLLAAADIERAAALAADLVVKTARLGYDGKGQRRTRGDANELVDAWDSLGRVPCVVEARLALEHELSVVLARTATGTVPYTVVENVHVDGILDLTIVPARVAPAVAADATELAVAVADRLGYVGVLGVELFVVDGAVVVNELAPRPHNSGHWTLDGARTDQFAQQVRAVTGSALGDPAATTPAAAMVNLLGDLWLPDGAHRPFEPRWEAVLAAPDARLHLYGKIDPRPGRKMGHVTVLGDDADAVAARALALRAAARRR